MRKLFKCRKALSPVVAAIILIAVTVAVSIAVAAWMGALTFTFMATEQITYTNFVWGTNNANCAVTIKNTGSTDLSIASVKIDGTAVTPTSFTPTGSLPYLLQKGNSVTINMTRVGGAAFASGVSYEFMVTTAKGNSFGPYTKTAP